MLNKKTILKIISLTIISLIISSVILFYQKNNKMSTDPKQEINIEEVKQYLMNNYDNYTIDGSTSMIPLHQALDDLFSNTKKEITHNKTVEAFEKFVDQKVDILLGVDYSNDLLDKAKSINLTKTAITKEAFVFLINKNNPVTNLTTDQIKAIYSGEITNWEKVGGDNALIKTYQRNADSGSQIRMEKFMGNTALMKKRAEYISSMGNVIETIGSYDQGLYSIAYNMFTFTENQYINSEVIMLKVNGIEPNENTIFNEKYPITIYNYIYYDQNNKSVAEFVDNLYLYLMSEQGQKLISESGYVNLNKQFDINKRITIPQDDETNTENYLGFYNEQKNEYYDVDIEGNLLVFDSFNSFVLRDSKYKNNTNAINFINMIINSKLPLVPSLVRLNEDEGYISLNPWFDASLNAEDFFMYKYEDNYYSYLQYFIDEDSFVLTSIEKEIFDSYLEPGWFDHMLEYTNNYIPDASIKLTKTEIENIFLMDKDYIWDSTQIDFNYFKLFENSN